jgi:hypothetical protein
VGDQEQEERRYAWLPGNVLRVSNWEDVRKALLPMA